MATSEILACTNLVLVAAIYWHIEGRIVTAIQVVVIPVVLLATIAFVVRDFFRPGTRLQSLVALALSLPAGFMYSVWNGWISP